MTRQNVTRSELAKQTGLSPQYITDMLNGRKGEVPNSWAVVLEVLGLELRASGKTLVDETTQRLYGIRADLDALDYAAYHLPTENEEGAGGRFEFCRRRVNSGARADLRFLLDLVEELRGKTP